MPLFGNKEVFAIEYRLLKHAFGGEPGLLGASWGYIRFWLKNKDLFEKYPHANGRIYYEWNLCYLAEWFCTNLGWIIKEDPFPFPVEGNTALELMDKVRAREVRFDTPEDDEWNHKRYVWSSQHFIINAENGCYLPIMFLRAHQGKIEINWDNANTYDNMKFKFLYNSGLEYIEKKVFFDAVYGFVTHFINRFKDEYPEQIKEDYEEPLEKALALIPEFAFGLREKLV